LIIGSFSHSNYCHFFSRVSYQQKLSADRKILFQSTITEVSRKKILVFD
jgi:hypothetical protein